MPDQVLQHWEDFGTANTPTAKNGIRIDVVIEGVRRDDGVMEVHINVTTTNFAAFDNATGAVKVGLLNDNGAVAEYVASSPRNPGRGFQPPTVRQGFRSDVLPQNQSFKRIGLSFTNLDNPDGFTVDWQKIIELGVTIITTTLSVLA